MANKFDSDERLTKNAGSVVRSDRSEADEERIQQNGTALSDAERRAQLRNDWVQEILPTPPKLPGFHVCWLSTTNSMDPIYKRMQRGYVPVKSSEVKNFAGASSVVKDGEFQGCISCNEMLLFKVEEQLYQDLMTIYHFDMPQEQEQGIYNRVNAGFQQDSNGKRLDIVEGEFNTLGRKNAPTPTFN